MITGVIDNMGLPIRARHCGGYFLVRSTGTLPVKDSFLPAYIPLKLNFSLVTGCSSSLTL